jgi:hypothetical protein
MGRNEAPRPVDGALRFVPPQPRPPSSTLTEEPRGRVDEDQLISAVPARVSMLLPQINARSSFC